MIGEFGPLCSGVAHLVEFGVQRAAELHVLDQVGALTLVWGDDADLIRLCSSLQQPGGDLFHVGSLGSLTLNTWN